MYVTRWQADEAGGRPYLTLSQGLHDAWSRRVVSYSWADWRAEVPWMTLYFSVCVWWSLALVRALGLNRTGITTCSSFITLNSRGRRLAGVEAAGAGGRPPTASAVVRRAVETRTRAVGQGKIVIFATR